jgi:hypothetical protein
VKLSGLRIERDPAEKYKQNFTFRAKSLRREVSSYTFPMPCLPWKRRRFACIFQVVEPLSIRPFRVIVTIYAGTDRSTFRFVCHLTDLNGSSNHV